jgi:hypothetical protein
MTVERANGQGSERRDLPAVGVSGELQIEIPRRGLRVELRLVAEENARSIGK